MRWLAGIKPKRLQLRRGSEESPKNRRGRGGSGIRTGRDEALVEGTGATVGKGGVGGRRWEDEGRSEPPEWDRVGI